MARFCENCGNPIEPGLKFCVNCGAAVSDSDNVPAAQENGYSAAYYSAESPARVLTDTPVRTRKKIIIPICIAAGVLVLGLAIFLIVFNTNKAKMSHTTMGDAGYAHSVVMGALSSGKTTNVVNKAVQSAVESQMAMQNIREELYNSYSQSTYAGMQAEYTTRMINEAIKTNGLSVSLSASAELDKDVIDELKDMAESAGMDGDIIDSLITDMKKYKLYAAEKTSDDALEYAISFFEDNNNLGGAQFRYEKNGTATLVFPEISEHGISFELPELTWSELKKDIPEAYDYKKLIDSISEKTKKVFEDFDYEYDEEPTTVNGVDFNGLTIGIDLDMRNISELGTAVLEAVLDEDDFIDYLADSMGSDAEDIERSLENAISNLEYYAESDYYDSIKFSVKIYMNNDNTIAGLSLKVKDSRSSSNNAEFVFISNGVDAAASVKSGGTELFSFDAKGESASEGEAKITIRPSYGSSQKYTIKVKYKDFGTMEVFGMPAIKGSFEISVDDSTASLFFPYNEQAADILSDANLLVSILPSGKGAELTIGAEMKKYGKVSFAIAVDEPSGDVAPKPEKSYDLTDINDIDGDFSQMLSDDVMDYFEKQADNGNAFASLVVVPTMIGVTQDSRITSANTLASNIKNRVTEFMSKMDTIKASYVGGAKTLIVTATQNASGGSDWSVSGGVASDWRDGKNHYGTSVNTTSITTRDTELAAYIADTLTDMKQCYAVVYIDNTGKVVGVAAIEGVASLPAGVVCPVVTDFTAGYMTWAGNKSGLSTNGVIIGTAPVIANY